jgi:hypothetical protein
LAFIKGNNEQGLGILAEGLLISPGRGDGSELELISRQYIDFFIYKPPSYLTEFIEVMSDAE